MEPITLSDLDRVDEYCEKATDGEWFIHWGAKYPHIKSMDGSYIQEYGASVRREADAQFIAQSRTDLPRLSAALREMMGENEKLRELLRPRSYDGNAEPVLCPACHGAMDDHRVDCVVDAYQTQVVVIEAVTLRARVKELEDELGRVLADLNQVEADRAALAATEKE